MASKRWWIRAVVVLGSVVVALGGCGNRGDSGPAAPSAEEVAAAEYTILAATQTMFTWYPTVDASPADAYQRAAPALRTDMRAGFNAITDGAAALWPRWRTDKLTLTAVSRFAPGSVATNASGQIDRAVVVTQTAMFPDGKVDTSRVFTVDRVVANYASDGWKVEAINFFPENQFFIPTCPPGNTHDPAPDGPCKPIPPPPTRTCPDGTSVPASAVCPAQRNQPQTKTCPDGSTVAAGAECATHGPRTKQCPDGSTVLDTEECGTAGTQTCPEAQTRAGDGTCTSPVVTCKDGSTAPALADCPLTVVTCPDGTTVPDGQTCKPVTCPDGQSVPNGQTCPPKPCPDGASVPNGSSCPAPCPGDQVRGSDGVCRCPAGTRAESSGVCGPIINVAPLAPGSTSTHTVSLSKPPATGSTPSTTRRLSTNTPETAGKPPPFR